MRLAKTKYKTGWIIQIGKAHFIFNSAVLNGWHLTIEWGGVRDLSNAGNPPHAVINKR